MSGPCACLRAAEVNNGTIHHVRTEAFRRRFQKPEPNSEFSSHGRGDSHWLHAAEKTKTSVLGFAVALTLSFSVIELVGGLWGNSLALIGDAGHMVTDSASLLSR